MRKMFLPLLAAAMLALPAVSQAGSRNDAVIGSILGGATGAVIGNNLGGRDGAIVGGAIGAAAGVAIATDNGSRRGYDDGTQRVYRDNRYRNDYYDRGRDYRREVVVESPRYYYQGNEFVYGVPPRNDHYDNGRHRGWDRHRHGYDRGPEVVIIQQAPRYSRYEGDYCPPPRRW
jgi:hypothetical protein